MKTDPIDQWINLETRRQFFGRAAKGVGGVALASMLQRDAQGANDGGVLNGGHFPGKAKRVIWLFMAGAPSQLDLWDYKPR